jgi:hypothetical protein
MIGTLCGWALSIVEIPSIHAGLRVFFFVSGRGLKSLRNSQCARVPENDLSSEMKVTSRMVTRVTMTSAAFFLCCQWLLMVMVGGHGASRDHLRCAHANPKMGNDPSLLY